ncbi:hypothetical protein [Clostridioides difficile]|uniref:hypothetical protein n=1 Tax=Clostridioides difficile TaxID=1496 RepID=UPI001EDC1DAF|nr:hypothetical protein [Clostridioides difficile]
MDSSFEELKNNFIDDTMSNSEKEKITNNQNRKNNIEKAQQESVACCPKCGSTSLTAQKGFWYRKSSSRSEFNWWNRFSSWKFRSKES